MFVILAVTAPVAWALKTIPTAEALVLLLLDRARGSVSAPALVVTTSSLFVGPVVPMPTLPEASMTNGDASFATSFTAKDKPEPIFSTPNTAKGVVLPMPTFLAESNTSPVPPTVRSEEKRFVEDAVVEKK